MTTGEINHALRLYLGVGANCGVRPYGMVERVEAEFGAESAPILEEVRRVLDGLVDGLLDDQERAQLPSVQEIVNLASQRARARRPDLQDDVCRAIGNYIAYSFR